MTTDMTESDIDNMLKKIYYNPETGFIGASKIHEGLKKNKINISVARINQFLSKQSVVQQTQKITKRSKAGFIGIFPHQQYQIDLIYMQNPGHNKMNRYVLTVVDIFTKIADAEALTARTSEKTLEAFKKIVKRSRMGLPFSIYSDKGVEFTNNAFQAYLSNNSITQIWALDHATIIERFNRTLKELVYRFLKSSGSKDWNRFLPILIKNYNNSFHSTIKMSPSVADNDENLSTVQLNIENSTRPSKLDKLKVGTNVRVMLTRKGFVKGYAPKFSDIVYTIRSVEKSDGTGAPTYYNINGAEEQKYLRAQLRVVNDVESGPQMKKTRSVSNNDKEQVKIDVAKVLKKEGIDDTLILNTKRIRK